MERFFAVSVFLRGVSGVKDFPLAAGLSKGARFFSPGSLGFLLAVYPLTLVALSAHSAR